jgi:hypothetical protein
VYFNRGTGVVPFGVAALAVALYTVLHPEVRKARSAHPGQLQLDLNDDLEGRPRERAD